MSTKQQTHLEAELERLKGKRGQLKDDLSRTEERIAAVQVQLSPIKVGDVVIERDTEYVVRAIEAKSWGGCIYRASKRKKNGEWALRTEQLWNALAAGETP